MLKFPGSMARPWLGMALLVLAAGCASQTAYVDEGDQLADEGKYDAAIAQYLKALEETPEEAPRAHLGLGVVYIQTGRLEEAEQALSYSLKRKTSRRALVALATLYHRQRRFGEAEKLMGEAIAKTTPETRDPSLLYRLGIIQADAGKTEAAADSFRQALAAGYEVVDSSIRLAKLLRELRKDEEALDCLRQASRTPEGSKNTNLYLMMGEIQETAGMLDYAESAFREALERDPKNSAAAVGVSRVLRAKRKPADAVEFMMVRLRGSEGNADLLLELAEAYFDYLLKPEAIETLRKAILVAPSRPEPYKRLIATLEAQGKQDKEIYELLRKASSGVPGDLDLQLRFGAEACARKETKACVEAMEQVLKLEPNNGEAHYALGVAALRSGNRDKAAAHFEALKLIDEERAVQLLRQIEAAPEKPAPVQKKAKKKKKTKKKAKKKKKKKTRTKGRAT